MLPERKDRFTTSSDGTLATRLTTSSNGTLATNGTLAIREHRERVGSEDIPVGGLTHLAREEVIVRLRDRAPYDRPIL